MLGKMLQARRVALKIIEFDEMFGLEIFRESFFLNQIAFTENSSEELSKKLRKSFIKKWEFLRDSNWAFF
jgi:hypothetical protein